MDTNASMSLNPKHLLFDKHVWCMTKRFKSLCFGVLLFCIPLAFDPTFCFSQACDLAINHTGMYMMFCVQRHIGFVQMRWLTAITEYGGNRWWLFKPCCVCAGQDDSLWVKIFKGRITTVAIFRRKMHLHTKTLHWVVSGAGLVITVKPRSLVACATLVTSVLFAVNRLISHIFGLLRGSIREFLNGNMQKLPFFWTVFVPNLVLCGFSMKIRPIRFRFWWIANIDQIGKKYTANDQPHWTRSYVAVSAVLGHSDFKTLPYCVLTFDKYLINQ